MLEILWVKQGKWEAAFDFYQQPIELKPDLVELYYRLLKVKPNCNIGKIKAI
ncbi:MAG: hypothetical protein WBA93_34905 [Microcoleaceae cyanobacterium]